MQEYLDVLLRPKFSRFSEFLIHAERLLKEIETRSIKVIPSKKIELISDKDDNKTPKEYFENYAPT